MHQQQKPVTGSARPTPATQAVASTGLAGAAAVLGVQRSAGNRATGRWLARRRLLQRAAAGQALTDHPWWREQAHSVHSAIGAENFTRYPDGAFWLINPLNDVDRGVIVTYLDAQDLEQLVAHGQDAVNAGVPNAQDIVDKAAGARAKRRSGPGEEPALDGVLAGELRREIQAIPYAEIGSRWSQRRADFLTVANDPANSLSARQMFQIWMRAWIDRQAWTHEEYKRQDAAVRAADALGYLEKRPLFDAGKRGVFPPEFEQAADEKAAADYYLSYLDGVHDWLETYVDGMHKRVTIQQVNEKTVELIKAHEIHLTILAFVIAWASSPVRPPRARPGANPRDSKDRERKAPAEPPPTPKAPTAILPNGKPAAPSHHGGGYTAPGGNDPRTMEEVFAKGLPARGNDWRLLEHAQPGSEGAKPELGGSAFRGTTRTPASVGEAGQGAADWAGKDGIIYEVRHVPTWHVEEVLHGQIKDPHGTYGGQLHVKPEAEGAIGAQVPADCIVRAGRVSETSGGKAYVKEGDWTPNPNHRPR
jgi:hypothetical protein